MGVFWEFLKKKGILLEFLGIPEKRKEFNWIFFGNSQDKEGIPLDFLVEFPPKKEGILSNLGGISLMT